jgi:Uma2 family endonuclease
MTTTGRKITAEDLLSMPDDCYRYELVKGELRKMAPAGKRHGVLAIRVTGPLWQHVQAYQLGEVCAAETGFRLSSSPDTVRAPDVAFISQQRLEEIGDVEGYWPGAPDLAVEVISPNDNYTEVEDKVLAWLDAGTRMVLVVNPRTETVTVYRSLSDVTILTKNDTLEGKDAVPGWTLAIEDLFV